MVRAQSFAGIKDESPYTHLQEFEKNCSIINIPGMSQETLKWKLFPFSLTGLVKKWHARNVGGVEISWKALKDKFCFTFFPLDKIVNIQVEVFTFRQGERKSLGAAWACYTNLVSSSPDLAILEPMLMQHFIRGLDLDSAKILDIASGRAFAYKTVKEVREVLSKILDNTFFSGAYEEEPIEEVQTLAQISSQEQLDPPCSQIANDMSEPPPCSISEPEPQPFMDSYDLNPDFPYSFYDELFHGFYNAARQPIMENQVVHKC
jgi:hypothetical protein